MFVARAGRVKAHICKLLDDTRHRSINFQRPLLASWWKFHTLNQTTNNTHTHLVLLCPSIAARTIKETKDRRQTRAIIVFLFAVCPNAAPKNTSRWKALRCTDSCDCLMACICQSKEGAWRLHLKTSNKRVYFSARRLVSTFQVALIVDTRTNTSSILVSRLRSRWYL